MKANQFWCNDNRDFSIIVKIFSEHFKNRGKKKTVNKFTRVPCNPWSR